MWPRTMKAGRCTWGLRMQVNRRQNRSQGSERVCPISMVFDDSGRSNAEETLRNEISTSLRQTHVYLVCMGHRLEYMARGAVNPATRV